MAAIALKHPAARSAASVFTVGDHVSTMRNPLEGESSCRGIRHLKRTIDTNIPVTKSATSTMQPFDEAEGRDQMASTLAATTELAPIDGFILSAMTSLRPDTLNACRSSSRLSFSQRVAGALFAPVSVRTSVAGTTAWRRRGVCGLPATARGTWDGRRRFSRTACVAGFAIHSASSLGHGQTMQAATSARAQRGVWPVRRSNRQCLTG